MLAHFDLLAQTTSKSSTTNPFPLAPKHNTLKLSNRYGKKHITKYIILVGKAE